MLSRRAGRNKLLALVALYGLAANGLAANAAEPKSIALADFELIDHLRAFYGEEARREDERRLALIGAELARELERRRLYRVSCTGCSAERGRALGAERAAACWVQKVSNLILNINIEVRDVATGRVLYVRSVDIRGNTDESWLRGVRRLVDNIGSAPNPDSRTAPSLPR